MSDAVDKVAAAYEAGKRKGKRSGAPQDAAAAGAFKMPYDLTFPPDCPVEPLGINGTSVYFLDCLRQLTELKAKDLNKGTIMHLFSEKPHLKFVYWPRYGESQGDERPCTGWRPEQAADCLLQEAARHGIIDVLEKVRGPGCWRDEEDNLVMHCGDTLYHGGAAIKPQTVGRYYYPADFPRPHPGDGHGKAEAEELLALLKSWHWRRPEVDPYLLLGWIGAAILGGALDWRPLIWLTGDKATGKSTLHQVIKDVLGPGGLIATADASAAALWQTVGHKSLPVAMDELESESDNRKQAAIIKLARIAASGSQLLRGGADHKSSSFTVRSAFLFSSILIPAMLPQDISRMAILQLDDLPPGAVAPSIGAKRLAGIGAALRGRIMRQWPRFMALMETYKAQLAQAGHGGRGGDLFGTLLACHDLLLHDYAPDSDSLDHWKGLLRKSTLAESEGDVSNHERCVSHLMTSQMDLYRGGERSTVGQWVLQAAGLRENYRDAASITQARQAIANIGLLVQDKLNKVTGKTEQVLQVANEHQGLALVFKESLWNSAPGTDGVWMQALRRIPGAEADRQRFNGFRKPCTAVPISALLGRDEEGDDA